MINSLLQSVVFRLGLSLLLERFFGLGHLGIYWAECLSPLLPALFAVAFLRSGRWRRNPLLPG